MSGQRVSALLLVAASGFAACGGGSGGSAPSIDDPPITEVDGTDVPATDPPATDPTDGPRCGVVVNPDDDIDEYDPIACAQPHDAEFAGLEPTTAAPDAPDDLETRIAHIELCTPAVEALVGRSLDGFGVNVGAVRDAANSGADNVECWASLATPDLLVDSLTEVDLASALGDAVFLQPDLTPGECFLSFEVGYDIVTRADCRTPGAEQFIAVVELPGDDWPGEDDVKTAGSDLCEGAAAEVEFDLISDGIWIIYPGEEGWTALGQRGVICGAAPAGEATDADALTASAENPCAGSSDDTYPALPCDELHHAEFAGSVSAPVDVLPEDSDEAEAMGITACRDTVVDFIGLGRRPLGVTVGFVAHSGLGEPLVDDLSCYVSTDLADGFLGSVADIGFEAAFQKIVVPELDPGSCFALGESNFFLADPADCADADALMYIGAFDLGDGPYPGEDAIREIRAIECARLLDESSLAADPASVSGTFPGERDWRLLDQRTVACDATPLSFITGG